MNLIKKIKKLFIKNKMNVDNSSTTLSPYDVSDVDLPNINELNNEQKDLFFKYKNNISFNSIENILKYNENIAKEGEHLANLLIKILYELNDVIRKDDKTEEKLQEFDINISIKNMKVIVIRELLYNLKNDSLLKALAIRSKRQEYEQKNYKFIEFFSHAARIKRNMELRNLREAENRSKITIKTIVSQLIAINNAIISNNIYQNNIDIYNNLVNSTKKNDIRKKAYLDKIVLLENINRELNCQFTKLAEIRELLNNDFNEQTEGKLLENLAITEVELDIFINKNKDKIISDYLRDYIRIANTSITHENKNKLLEEVEKLEIIAKVFEDYMGENYNLEALYYFKFYLLSFDINNQIGQHTAFYLYLPKVGCNKEINCYIKIISDKIADIYQGKSQVARMFQEKNLLKQIIKNLNQYFKSFDGKYKYTDILLNRELLALLLAFDSVNNFYKFFQEYKYPKNGVEVDDDIILPWMNFEWNNYLPLETIYTLYEISGKNKPIFYDIYKTDYRISKNYNFSNSCSLPEGIKTINNNMHGDIELISYIRKKSDNKVVVLPSTLKQISGNVFGNSKIRNLILNNGLEHIGNFVFLNQELEHIEIPSSVSVIEANAFNFNDLELIFNDYKNSKLLYNLLYCDNDYNQNLIKKLFKISYNEDYKKEIKVTIKNITLNDKEDGKIKITRLDLIDIAYENSVYIKDDIERIRYNLPSFIKEKAGVNLKEYQERKIKQKKLNS